MSVVNAPLEEGDSFPCICFYIKSLVSFKDFLLRWSMRLCLYACVNMYVCLCDFLLFLLLLDEVSGVFLSSSFTTFVLPNI